MKFRIFVPLAGDSDSIREDWLEYKDILVLKPNNSSHICKIFNEEIEKAIEDKIDALILTHDDIRIEDKYIFEKIEKAFEDYDILGIAGEIGEAGEVPRSIHPTVAWNSGICKHTHRHHVDYFGPTPSQCVMMDGCFLVINIMIVKVSDQQNHGMLMNYAKNTLLKNGNFLTERGLDNGYNH